MNVRAHEVYILAIADGRRNFAELLKERLLSPAGRKSPMRVDLSSSAEKQQKRLSDDLRDVLYTLKHGLEQKDPVQTGWLNYSQIVNATDFHHCHINSGVSFMWLFGS